MEHRFDELAKVLAEGLTRRGALRRIGGSLTGALLASLGIGKARGQGPGNSDCAHFCTSVFPPGPARGQCISDAAHGQGLCYQCGPAAPPGNGPLCGTVCCRSDQVCTNGVCACPSGTEECGGACLPLCPAGMYHDPSTCQCVCNAGTTACGTTCCTSSQECCNGACYAPCPAGTTRQPDCTCSCQQAGGTCAQDTDCCAGLTCSGGICSAPGCAGATCATFTACSSGNPDCVCVTLQPSGAGLCVPGSTSCASLTACNPDFSCPAGQLCAVNTCCGNPVCVPVDLQQMCNATAAATAFSDGGLTIAG